MIRLHHSIVRGVALLLGVLGVVTPQAAQSACGGIPNVFVNNVSTLDANSTNANNNSLYACVTNVDWTQIGVQGLFASNLIPITAAQATFGGTQNYTFLRSVTAAGLVSSTPIIAADATSGTQAWVAPVYTAAGGPTAAAEHVVRGTVTVTVPMSSTIGTNTQVSLAGAAQFTSATSYSVTATVRYSGSTYPSGWNVAAVPLIVSNSATSFYVTVANSGTSTSSTGSILVDYEATGY